MGIPDNSGCSISTTALRGSESRSKRRCVFSGARGSVRHLHGKDRAERTSRRRGEGKTQSGDITNLYEGMTERWRLL
jgi:hypothetical protein